MRCILAVLVIAVAQWSCQSSPTKQNQLADSLRPVKVGALWGYADDSGVTRIKPRFHYAHEFSNGFAMVQPDYAWGVRFIDARGTVVTGEKFFEWAGPFGDGLAPARAAERIYGFIDAHGQWVINPQYYGVHSFTEGLAAVQATENGAWGTSIVAGAWQSPRDIGERASSTPAWRRLNSSASQASSIGLAPG